jgi:hypothetical protein
VATNTSKEAFKAEVFADRGMAVDEEDGWLNDGKTTITIFSDPQSGDLSRTFRTPPKRPAWVGDLGSYMARVTSDAAGFAMAAPVSQAVGQAMRNGGHVDLSWGLLSTAPSMAVAGFFASALTTFMVPPDGPVSWQRRVMMRGMIPVASAMAAAGSTGGFGFWTTLGIALAAAAGVELVTAGERSVGLRRWRGGDERKNPVGRVFGFFGLRTLHLSAYRALAYFVGRLIGA